MFLLGKDYSKYKVKCKEAFVVVYVFNNLILGLYESRCPFSQVLMFQPQWEVSLCS